MSRADQCRELVDHLEKVHRVRDLSGDGDVVDIRGMLSELRRLHRFKHARERHQCEATFNPGQWPYVTRCTNDAVGRYLLDVDPEPEKVYLCAGCRKALRAAGAKPQLVNVH